MGLRPMLPGRESALGPGLGEVANSDGITCQKGRHMGMRRGDLPGVSGRAPVATEGRQRTDGGLECVQETLQVGKLGLDGVCLACPLVHGRWRGIADGEATTNGIFEQPGRGNSAERVGARGNEDDERQEKDDCLRFPPSKRPAQERRCFLHGQGNEWFCDASREGGMQVALPTLSMSSLRGGAQIIEQRSMF